MKYYRDVDYFIYFEDFPHMGIPGVIVANCDGTANIFINTLYSNERQAATIRHELRHLVKQHQYCDWKSIGEKEAEADEDDPSYIFATDFSYVEYVESPVVGAEPQKEQKIPNVFAESNPGTIPFFSSLEAFGRYIFAMQRQYGKGKM